MLLGDERAGQLGVRVERFKLLALGAASLVVAGAVSVSGLIGFVGLMMPHMMRLIVGPRHRLLLPASVLAGAIALVVADLHRTRRARARGDPGGHRHSARRRPVLHLAARAQGASAMTGRALEFRKLAVGYGARTVLREASFEVRPGEFVGLVGPNGAGKSTLLRAVTGGADVLDGDIWCGASRA